MNADPQVREFFPSLLSRAESEASVARIESHFERHGYGFWALEIPGTATFSGMVGLAYIDFTAHFTPCVEIGWRLAVPFWNKGYATEAARAALEFGFKQLQLDEIISYTVPANTRSRRVMERIGMNYDAHGDFEHPSVAEGHALRKHVLYRIHRDSTIR